MTDEEIKGLADSELCGLLDDYTSHGVFDFARAIIAARDEELRKQGGATVFSDKTMYAAPTPPTVTPSREEAYQELIYAVARKFPNETRHQTALRYIMQAERGSSQCESAKAARPEGEKK